MDDLDHSMHIAECDWTVFYEESEECDLPQPPLARHDSASLTDLEDSGNSSPVCSAGPKGPNAAANGDGVGSSAAGCCLEEKNYSGCEKYTSRPNIQSGATGEGDLATKAEMRLAPSVGAEHLAKDPALKGEDGDVQMEGDVKRDPLPGDRAAVDLNESHAADRAARRGVTGAALGGEKERWFVTVNVSPAPRRPRAVPVRKRQRRKRNLKGKDTCRPGQDGSHEDGLELQIMGEHCEFDPEDVTTENPTRVKDLAEEDPESTQKGILSGASQMPLTPRAEDGWSEELVTPPSPKRSVGEPMTSGESAASDEFEDVVDFSSTHSSDSESFVSAAESLEEQRHSQSSSSPTENPNLLRLSANGGADDDAAQGGHVPSCNTALSPSVTAANSEGHERADATQTFPSAAVDKLAADADTPSETRGPPKRGISPPACGSPSGDRLLSVPDLTVTRCCCEADSPETYAEAAGHERPVYAISAFWDEMERLTINDILQLRAGGSGPPRGTPHVEDLVSLEDTREHSPCDGRLTDVSSTADSDYFTQPDESKPDRWSWDFSTSDAEEEYSSGNPSPEPRSDKGRSASGAGREEETATSNEGNATLVPSGDVARTRPEDEDEDAFASRRLARPRRITKSRSVQNVRALNAERLPAQVLPGDDESSRFLGAEGLLKASGSLLAPIPAPLTDGHYEIVFPEGFQDAFREDETESDFCCVPAYEPGDVSVSPGMDFPLWTFRDEMPFFSLHDEKPIPIFSSSRPTVRELTFSNPPWVFLSADREEDDDHFSPIRVSSRAFVHGSDCGAAAPHGIYVWKSLMRKIRFPDKGGSWRGTSGSWAVPVEKSADPSVSSAPSQLFRELAAQQSVWEAFRTTRREGIFSTLKQSDMCLVCIAFASWVLKSSDPDGADAWKAAVLANVSALSAIQYLRHYVKKKNPS